MSIPGGSWGRPLIGEVGRGRFCGGTDPGVGTSVIIGCVCPETTPAKVRGLLGGVVGMSTTVGAERGPMGMVTVDGGSAGRVGPF